ALEEHLVEAERGDVQVQAEDGRNKYRKDVQRDHQHILRYLHLRHLPGEHPTLVPERHDHPAAHKEPPEPPFYPLVRKRHPVDLDPPCHAAHCTSDEYQERDHGERDCCPYMNISVLETAGAEAGDRDKNTFPERGE